MNPRENTDDLITLIESLDDGPWYVGKLSITDAVHTRENCTHIINSNNETATASISAINYHELVECKDCYLIRTHNIHDINNINLDETTAFSIRLSKENKTKLDNIVTQHDEYDTIHDIIREAIEKYFNGSFTLSNIPHKQNPVTSYRTKLTLDNKLYKQVIQSVYNGEFANQATVIRTIIRSYLHQQDTHRKQTSPSSA